MIPDLFLSFNTCDEWRAWLEKNHTSIQAVWLVYYKAHKSTNSLEYDCTVEEALCFGWIDSIIKHLDDVRYARKFTKRTNPRKWSHKNISRMKRLIESGRMTPAGLAVIAPGILNGNQIQTVRKTIQFELSEEYLAMLQANSAAWTFFNSLPPSHKRRTIGWVMSAIKKETKIKRMEEVIKLMSAGKRLGLK